MSRRRVLQLGAGAGVILAMAGLGVSMWRPGWRAGALSESGREIFGAVAQAVLDGCLPTDPTWGPAAMQGYLTRIEASIAGLAPANRDDLANLLALLGTTLGRRALTGLTEPWAQAPTEQVQAALNDMRLSDNTMRQQAYHALRDLTNAAWFADPSAWALLGYPGPRPI